MKSGLTTRRTAVVEHRGGRSRVRNRPLPIFVRSWQKPEIIGDHLRRGPSAPRAFSLIELIVVISITSLLMAMLMPAMNKVRENAHRVICSNNQRQIGQSMVIFYDGNRD